MYKNGILVGARPETAGKMKASSFMAASSSRSLACDVAESTARELVCFGFGLDRGSVFVRNSCSVSATFFASLLTPKSLEYCCKNTVHCEK